MAHAKRRILATRPTLELSDAVWAFLNDQTIPDDNESTFEIFMLDNPNDTALSELWARARGEVMGAWLKDRPAGTRPSAWWKCEAPRQPMGNFPGCYFDGKPPAPRKQVSGAGCPAWLVLAHVPWYQFGLPMQWAGFEEGDPPVFESQAAYLRRHGLLTPHEVRVLTASDYERTEALPVACAVDLGPFEGPDAKGVDWLNTRAASIRARIPAARKGLGFFDCQQTRPN